MYLGAFTAASAADSAPVDFNTRAATVPAAATAVGVGVIDLPTVPTAAGAGVTYRMGYKTIGLTAEAGVPCVSASWLWTTRLLLVRKTAQPL